jgi:hypothetical protein
MNKTLSSSGTAPLGAVKLTWHLAIDSKHAEDALSRREKQERSPFDQQILWLDGIDWQSTTTPTVESICKQSPGMFSNPICTFISLPILLRHLGDLHSSGRESSHHRDQGTM